MSDVSNHMSNMLHSLIAIAKDNGLVITVELVPDLPLSMGSYTMKPIVRKARYPATQVQLTATDIPSRDLARTAEQQGLFQKFGVYRTDGSSAAGGKHHGCEYFVLDMTHDEYAQAAVQAYSEACTKTHPALSADLQRRYQATSVQITAFGCHPVRMRCKTCRTTKKEYLDHCHECGHSNFEPTNNQL